MAQRPPPLAELRRDLQEFIDKPCPGWLLKPFKGSDRLRSSASKLGGLPYPGDLTDWPRCPACLAPLIFVLQLNRQEFPQLWFPRSRNLLQVFRCSNPNDCGWTDDYGRSSDRYMLNRYIRVRAGRPRRLILPEPEDRELDPFIAEMRLRVEPIDDYPSFYEGREVWWGEKWVEFQDRYTTDEMMADEWFYGGDFWNLIENIPGTKIGGLPSWRQSGYPPRCYCRRIKAFIFQLASSKGSDDYELMIGDAGNIYYFVCRRCGEKSLETMWDCY